MWSDTFLEDEKWQKVRDSIPKPIYNNWDKISNKLKRASVQKCAQRLMESESTVSKTIDPFLRDIQTGKAFESEKTIKDIYTDLPKVNPLGMHLIPAIKADPGIPGEIEIDENGKLLNRYLTFTNFTKFLKDSYDQWLVNGLVPLVEDTVIELRGGRVKFRHVSLVPPIEGTTKIYPRMARERGITYGLNLNADIVVEKDIGDDIIETILTPKRTLGTIPLMLDSEKCWLRGLSPSELRAVGEDPSDPFGYFVVAGAEKVILMHEKLRLNRIFVTSKKRGQAEAEATITIETHKGTVRVKLVIGKGKRINFQTRFKVEIKPSSNREMSEEELKLARRRATRQAATAFKDGNYRYIGVEKLFYMLQYYENPGVSDEGDDIDTDEWPEIMTETIMKFTKPEWRNKIRSELSIMRLFYPNDKPEFVIGDIARIKSGATHRSPENSEEIVRTLIHGELFPQLNELKDIQNIYTLKKNMLGLMIVRLIEVNLGLAPFDDRDSWSNKRLETPSRAMDQLFRAIWRGMQTNIKKAMENKTIESIVTIKKEIDKIGITLAFQSSFIGTNWGVHGGIKTNMTQTVKRDSVIDLLSHLHRVEVATNRNDKHPPIRMIHGTQYGYVCPVESPEGKNCGIVKNLTVTAQVTYEKSDEVVIIEILEAKSKDDGSKLFSTIPSSRYSSPLLVNGKFLGWCMGSELRRHLVIARREQRIYIDVGIALNVRGTLLVHTDTSRLVRPLLVVEPVLRENGKLESEPLILTKDLMGAPIKTLFEEGVIEYIDSFEVESVETFVATTFRSVKDRKATEESLITSLSEFDRDLTRLQKALRKDPENKELKGEIEQLMININGTQRALNKLRDHIPFSHVEMDPNSILGISANAIPVANHNQGPRNTYQCLKEDTNVLMADGSEKAIRDVKIGEEILCFDPKTMIFERTKVVNQFVAPTEKKIYEIETSSERKITATFDHKFWTSDGWKSVEEFSEGKTKVVISSPQGKTSFVPVFRITEVESCMIADLTTESENHTFVANGFCVHNSGMYKQALAIMRAHHMACFTGKHKLLAFPNRPLFEPQINKLLNLNAYPQGEMVWVAFSTLSGNTQEDAFVWNKASIDLGKFRIYKYNNIRVTFKGSESGKTENLQLPSKISPTQRTTTFRHINENGLPHIGAHIKEREAVVGKVILKGKEEIVDESLLLGYGEEGIVDKIIVTDNGGEIIVKVSLRMLRIPIEGDKFTPRNAQKGTIGKIVAPEDMQFTEDGIIPDLIVNPHAMPSRMTMSYPMELIAGIAGAIVGQRINATNFREFEEEKFKSILRDYGYNDDGTHTMYNGTTGKKLKTQMYSGPVYFQALKHHVMDKIQVRRTGPYSATTHQPVKGRAKKGGLRFGEMERDVTISHGAAFFGQERLCGVSDCYKAVYCSCGQVVSKIGGAYACKNCKDDAIFAEVETTAALRLLNMFLSGFGFKHVFDFSKDEEQIERL